MNMKKIKWIWIKFWGNRYRVIKNDELLKEIDYLSFVNTKFILILYHD